MQWISVHKPPKAKGLYFGYGKYADGDDEMLIVFFDKKFYFNSRDKGIFVLTHWQPLPAPPLKQP